jgi:hypothetical protein
MLFAEWWRRGTRQRVFLKRQFLSPQSLTQFYKFIIATQMHQQSDRPQVLQDFNDEINDEMNKQ